MTHGNKILIAMAAGSGTRMGSATPKQFLDLVLAEVPLSGVIRLSEHLQRLGLRDSDQMHTASVPAGPLAGHPDPCFYGI